MNSAAPPRLLMVLPIVPWPLRRDGIALRFAPIVDHLARRYELDLLILAENAESPERQGPLELCRSITIIQVPVVSLAKFARKIKVAWSGLAPWGPPFGAARHFALRKLQLEVARYLEREPYAVVIWAAGYLDVALRIRSRYPEVRFVVDMIDSAALATARAGMAQPQRRWLFRYTAWKWRRLERRVQDIFDASIYISPVDACAARPDPPPRVHVIPNGISFADAPVSLPAAPHDSRVIGFLGDMSYQPNISAVLRLARSILPQILVDVGDARLLIIGRDPAPVIRALESATITVTGTVKDIWSYITRATVFVFPMFEGAGLQNKILEAMYAEVPVVTTTSAAAGVGAINGEHLLLGDTDEAIAAQTLKVLRDHRYAQQLAAHARQFVVREFDWKKILPRYEAIVAPPAGQHSVQGAVRPASPPRSGAAA
jgi:polysaccharide biosynthesis protein PslH